MKIILDGQSIDVAADETILSVARRVGIDIPTLCFLEPCEPATSCMVCIVKIKGQNRFVPSCATRVQEGMEVESETVEVHEARRTALELLLSDHVGDCLSPCHRICPFNLNIPALLREIETSELRAATDRMVSAEPLPLFVSRLCPAPCENGCRRGSLDEAAAIRDLERFIADDDIKRGECMPPRCDPSTHTSVLVVGSGPAGLSVAWELAILGQSVTVMERNSEIGGTLRHHPATAGYPSELLESEKRRLEAMGIRFKTQESVDDEVSLKTLAGDFDAVVLACGEGSKDWAEGVGLKVKGDFVWADLNTFKTSMDRVFAVGAMVKPVRQVIRLMSECIEAARLIHKQVLKQPIHPAPKPFTSIMGKLNPSELNRFAEGLPMGKRLEPAHGSEEGYSFEEAKNESSRCLHCDCRAVQHCKLKHFASRYHAVSNRYGSRAREFFQVHRHGSVVYEPGKCIACGICVQIAMKAGEPLGLTFVGRGFDVRIDVPLNGEFDEALQSSAQDCVDYCPTGALALKGKMHCC